MSFLSIIVPVFNKLDYIDSCITSILSQTFRDFELLIINDGSTDGSSNKCDYYATLDKRIKVFHQQNRGVSPARNFGLQKACGQFIGFIDADDIIVNDMYEVLINNALSTQADISICSIKKINNEKKIKKPLLRNDEIKIFNKDEGISTFLQGKFYFSASNKIFSIKIAKKIKFEGKVNEDVYYNFLAFSEAEKSVFQDIVKYFYIDRNSSVTNSKFNLRYLDMLNISGKILKIVLEKMPNHLQYAKKIDFTNNILVLNLLLLSGKNNYKEQYDLVKNNLNKYSTFIYNSNIVTKKEQIAYKLYRISPRIYSYILRLYSLFFAYHLIKITKK